ncbi:MAG: DNA mismatch repair protein MutS [Chloroflexota bacterium]|nr:DNA mismatch repair protein MutS [Chloroflexota bacterium]
MTTPIRRQYLRLKQQYPEAILFFRLGDFYETFDEDAQLASRELEITLTSRDMGKGLRVPMAGIPHHALDHYLARLIAKGHKVALCEQLSEPTKGRELVQRDVVRVVTPGTVVEPDLLEQKSNNYLAAVVSEGEEAGIAYVDITTGEFATTQLPTTGVAAELERLHPSEVLLAPGSLSLELPPPSPPTTHLREALDRERAEETLRDHFGALSLEAFGCAGLPLAIRAAAAILCYLQDTQKGALGQLARLATYSTASFMALDPQTRRNLELFQSSRWGQSSGSLLSVLDRTKTAMGGRLLKGWLGQPLLDIKQIVQRHEAVAWLVSHPRSRAQVVSLLGKMGDIERLTNRAGGGIATPRDMVALRRSLELIPQIREALEMKEGEESSQEASEREGSATVVGEFQPCPDQVELLARSLVDDPPPAVGEGNAIRPGFSPELDALRSASRDARQYLADLEHTERERTGIKSLKVGYNRVFGYYIEVTSAHLGKVPADYIRKQTLTGGERFYTPQLKEYESLILNAEERMAEMEGALFRQVCQQVAASAPRLLGVASALARLDVLTSFAEAAAQHGYARPDMTEDDALSIAAGRHPVVERALVGEGFVPNDTYLSNRDCQIIVLTGPNMAGKSTYLRQVALIVLMAQVGSFVPAASARLGVVDRIFTRVGLQDDLVTGRSTFMVEMMETAHILNHATPRSLIILDEIGRGTSTYDGLSIARAVVEFIHNHPRLGAKTLFATHYHEMVEMAQVLPRVKNFNVAVTEEGGKVVFLRQIIPGGADKSYGIHVAQLAGLPRPVIHRAQEVLAELEGNPHPRVKARPKTPPPPAQLPLLGAPSPALEELSRLDISSLTPLEAITKLYELQKKAKEAQP